MDLSACGRGSLGGLVAGLAFGIAHGIFLVWAFPPAVFGAVIGMLGGALSSFALTRSHAHPWMVGGLLALTALPLGVAAFLVAPWLGSTPWLLGGAALACMATGALCGFALGSGWPGVVAFAVVGVLVAGPGEPFIHEGPKPWIVGFYGGMLMSLFIAGFTAKVAVNRLPSSRKRPTHNIPSQSSSMKTDCD
jgi:hypothetical protein